MKRARIAAALASAGSLSLLLLAAASLAGPPAPVASAPPPPNSSDAGAPAIRVPAEIIILHATNTGRGIDPSIRSLPQLQKPPFSAYNTYKLIARSAVTLSSAQADTTVLPNRRVLKTSLLAAAPRDRYRISASISQPSADAGAPSYLPLLEVTAKSGEIFFVAGQTYQGGMLVVGIKVGEVRAAAPPAKP